jgi:hypothetical protein
MATSLLASKWDTAIVKSIVKTFKISRMIRFIDLQGNNAANTIQISGNENKTDWFEYLYFFMIVIYAGMASPITQSMMYYSGQPVAFIIPVFMTMILIIRNPVSFYDTSFLLVTVVTTVWLLLQFFKTSFFNVSYTFFIYYAIFIAYIVIKVFHFKMFFLYERIVTQLSVIAIIGWLAMILTPGFMAQFIDAIKIPQSDIGILHGNIIIFSMTDLGFYATQGEVLGLTRNSGFSWEPGRYAAMVVIALFFNMARTRFQFRRNISFWILLIALLTTQSTTGYITFLILLLFFMINQKKEFKIFYLILIIPLVLTIYSLPFVGEKINTLLNLEDQTAESLHDLSQVERDQYVPQRFDGLAFEFLNIINDPILGYGLEVKNSYVNKNISQALILSNGVLKIIARFGIIIAGLFYFLLYKSSKCIMNLYNLKGGIFFMTLYIAISISYDFIMVPFFLSSVMFYYFSNKTLTGVQQQEGYIEFSYS